MALQLIVTTAGRAALINAANTGTAPVTIAQVGFTATAVTPTPAFTALPGEFKRLDTLSGGVVADDTIHLTVRDESNQVFTVRSLALYLGDGTLFGLYGQAPVLIEKSAQAMMLLDIDVQFPDIAATSITFGDANFLNPPATTEIQGVVELTTLAEAIAGLDASRVPAAKMVKDAVTAWLDARFGAANAGIWHPGNDGAGSGMDADLLDGQEGSWYANIAQRLGFTPVQQGTGNGQLTVNSVKIGWSGTRLKASVDAADLGNLVFDGHIADVWRASNDGAGSGLDADLLDGQQGSYYTNIVARLGYAPWGPSNDGSGSGLDADLLDGQDSGYYTNIIARLGYTPLNTTAYTAADVKAKLLTVDGSGSGFDADLLDGQDGSYYTNIIARLGYTPVRQGGGSGQGANTVYIGWSGSRMKMQVDASDLGNLVFDGHIADVWRASNDGSGSGLDADMVDGWHRDSIRDWNNLINRPFNWAGQGGQPQWLWGGNAENQYYVYNPANFSVNYANSAWALSNSPGSAPHYSCRAWANFNGQGTVAIRASGNVSSITDLGTGRYRVNFATAMPDANYAAVGNCTQSMTGMIDPRRAALPLIREVTASDFVINTMGVQDADVWLDAAQVMIQVSR